MHTKRDQQQTFQSKMVVVLIVTNLDKNELLLVLCSG